MKKLRIGVIYGGRSGEHEVSVASAASVIKHLDRTRYEPLPIRIEKDGRWTIADRAPTAISAAEVIEQARVQPTRAARPGRDTVLVAHQSEDTLLTIERRPDARGGDEMDRATVTGLGLDVVFPVLHGPFGEDGTVQGLLELANVPYVGPGVLASAVGMDKSAMRRHVCRPGAAGSAVENVSAPRVGDGSPGGDRCRPWPWSAAVRETGQPRIERRHLKGQDRTPNCRRRSITPSSSIARS